MSREKLTNPIEYSQKPAEGKPPAPILSFFLHILQVRVAMQALFIEFQEPA
jgi:hypothetical protein